MMGSGGNHHRRRLAFLDVFLSESYHPPNNIIQWNIGTNSSTSYTYIYKIQAQILYFVHENEDETLDVLTNNHTICILFCCIASQPTN